MLNEKPIIGGNTFPNQMARPVMSGQNTYSNRSETSVNTGSRYGSRAANYTATRTTQQPETNVQTNVQTNDATVTSQPFPGHEIKPFCGDGRVANKVHLNGYYKYNIIKVDNMEVTDISAIKNQVLVDTESLEVCEISNSNTAARYKLLHKKLDISTVTENINVYAADILEKKEIGFCEIAESCQVSDYISLDIFNDNPISTLSELVYSFDNLVGNIISTDTFIESMTHRLNNYIAISGAKGSMENIIDDSTDFLAYVTKLADSDVVLHDTYVNAIKLFIDSVKYDLMDIDTAYESSYKGSKVKGILVPHKYTGILMYGLIAKVITETLYNGDEKDEKLVSVSASSYPTLYDILNLVFSKTKYSSNEARIFFNTTDKVLSVYKVNQNYILVK
jgi:hypothetical protein